MGADNDCRDRCNSYHFSLISKHAKHAFNVVSSLSLVCQYLTDKPPAAFMHNNNMSFIHRIEWKLRSERHGHVLCLPANFVSGAELRNLIAKELGLTTNTAVATDNGRRRGNKTAPRSSSYRLSDMLQMFICQRGTNGCGYETKEEITDASIVRSASAVMVFRLPRNYPLPNILG